MKRNIIGLIFAMVLFSGMAQAAINDESHENAQLDKADHHVRHGRHHHRFRLWSRHPHHEKESNRHDRFHDKGKNGHDRDNARHENNNGHGSHSRHKEQIKTDTQNK